MVRIGLLLVRIGLRLRRPLLLLVLALLLLKVFLLLWRRRLELHCLRLVQGSGFTWAHTQPLAYRATSLIRNRHPVGPYSRTRPRGIWWS